MKPMGMRVARWLLRWAGTGLWVAVLAPALALLPAAVLDRGPEGGTVRPSLFPLALVVLDPLVWECVRNSAAMALGVALGSLVLGTGLARLVGRWRFWGRPILSALVVAPLVVPPFFGALGLRRLVATLVAPAWPGSVSGAGWIGWAWVALASGVPLVAQAVTAALARFDAAWEESARLAGAGSRRIWRQLVWPSVRPGAARAAGLVFALTLIEPGAPLALGLRRTLGYQIVDAALGREPAPRAAVLAVLAAAVAIAARGLFRWWGRGTTPSGALDTPSLGRARAAHWLRAAWHWAILGLGIVLAWFPVLALMATALPRDRSWGSSAGLRVAVRRLFALDPELQRILLNSLALGLAVVAIDLALAWTLASWAGRRRVWMLSLAAWPELLPSLALGVGALVLPELVAIVADWARAGTGGAALARGAQLLAGELDAYRTPGIGLALAVAAVRLPFLARAVEHGWSRFQPTLIDAALVSGATPRQARRTATGLWLGAAPGALVLTFALAATNLAPALLLAPTFESRTIAPQILILADTPGGGFDQAAVLAAMAVAVNVTALGLAARNRAIHLGGWFGG
jgi:iron(III) transport system permease protein